MRLHGMFTIRCLCRLPHRMVWVCARPWIDCKQLPLARRCPLVCDRGSKSHMRRGPQRTLSDFEFDLHGTSLQTGGRRVDEACGLSYRSRRTIMCGELRLCLLCGRAANRRDILVQIPNQSRCLLRTSDGLRNGRVGPHYRLPIRSLQPVMCRLARLCLLRRGR